MSTHWGDLPIVPDTDSGIAALEREQMTKPRPMDVEGPALYQPSGAESPSQTQHPADTFVLDSLTLHTIKLVQYARKVRLMIQSVHQQLDNIKSEEGEGDGEIPTFAPAPPIPEYQAPENKHKALKPLSYLPKDPDSPFVRGLGEAPPEIDTRSCRRLLRRSVAAICGHAGYDNCGESILEALTDLSHEYLQQMTRLLRRATDNEALSGGTGFPDCIEQVFHEMGIGSPLVLHEFYQTRLVDYHTNIQRTCQQLYDDYSRVRQPQLRPLEEVKAIIKSKAEAVSDIQFPSLEESEEGAESDQILHLEGLGLDINIVSESSGGLATEEEGGKWEAGRTDTDHRSSVAEGYGQAGSPGEGPPSPTVISDTGDSLQDPGSLSDNPSPPSIEPRTGRPPKKKQKK